MLRKCATADVAGKRPLAAVCLQVNLEVTGRLEALAAQPTAVWLVDCVVLLVRAQVSDGAEPLATEHARARNGCCVRLEVFAKGVHAGRCGAACNAR